jgi:hypothetical protein
MTPSSASRRRRVARSAAAAGDEPDWETYNRARRALEAKGFVFGPDPRVADRYPSIAKYHHQARCGDLWVDSEVYPAGCKFEFYQELVTENPNGGRYDFDRVAKMPYLIRKKFELCIATLKRHLESRGFDEHRKIASPIPDPLAYFNDRWDSDYERRRGVHRFKRDDSGWPHRDELPAHGRFDRDGAEIGHGEVRYFRDHKGYLSRGRCYGGINGRWLVIVGSGQRDFTHINASELFACDPARIPRKVHPRPRKLAAVLKDAVDRQDFERAIVVRDLIKRSAA